MNSSTGSVCVLSRSFFNFIS